MVYLFLLYLWESGTRTTRGFSAQEEGNLMQTDNNDCIQPQPDFQSRMNDTNVKMGLISYASEQ